MHKNTGFDVAPDSALNWQAAKSQMTRTTILEATCECIAKYGYANTTTPRIADIADVSRGAMTHHFKSREDVIFAGAAYLYQSRLEEYKKLMAQATESYQQVSGRDSKRQDELMRHIVRGFWKYFTLPSYYVHLDLIVASRTDPKLAAHIEYLNREAEKVVPQIFKQFLSIFKKSDKTAELVFDLLFFTLRGMSISYVNNRKHLRVENMLDHLAHDCLNLINTND
ncbi:MAG: TetR/AcrR family transcriptional regulator [Pseudomonadales bacterium]|nr:TetR/AcrR family transcriptional regulator [Pseudomonadales bacterium]